MYIFFSFCLPLTPPPPPTTLRHPPRHSFINRHHTDSCTPPPPPIHSPPSHRYKNISILCRRLPGVSFLHIFAVFPSCFFRWVFDHDLPPPNIVDRPYETRWLSSPPSSVRRWARLSCASGAGHRHQCSVVQDQDRRLCKSHVVNTANRLYDDAAIITRYLPPPHHTQTHTLPVHTHVPSRE